MAGLKASHWADVLTDQLHTFLGNFLGIASGQVLCLDCNKADGDFTLDLISNSNNNSFSDETMLHEYFLHFTSGEPMPCCVDDVIFSCHNVEVSIFVDKP